MVECEDAPRLHSLGQHNQRGVGNANLLVSVPINDRAGGVERFCVESSQDPGTPGQFLKNSQLSLDSVPGRYEIVEFSHYIW